MRERNGNTDGGDPNMRRLLNLRFASDTGSCMADALGLAAICVMVLTGLGLSGPM